MCPIHCNLCFLKKNSSIFSTPVISQIVSLFIPSLSVLSYAIRSILILVVCNFHLSLQTNSQHHNVWHFLHNFYACFLSSFNDRTFLHSTLAISLKFFYPHFITASCTFLPELRTSPRYKNFAAFSVTSPSSFTFLSTLVLSVKPEHFFHTKSTYYLGQALFYYMASFIHPTATSNAYNEVSSTFPLHTKHENLEVFIAIILLQVEKAFVFFAFTCKPFSVIALFHRIYLFSAFFQLFLNSTKSSLYRSFFTPPAITSFAISSITTASERGLRTNWWTPVLLQSFLIVYHQFIVKKLLPKVTAVSDCQK